VICIDTLGLMHLSNEYMHIAYAEMPMRTMQLELIYSYASASTEMRTMQLELIESGGIGLSQRDLLHPHHFWTKLLATP